LDTKIRAEAYPVPTNHHNFAPALSAEHIFETRYTGRAAMGSTSASHCQAVQIFVVGDPVLGLLLLLLLLLMVLGGG
jgi:hypothetical protein